MDQIICKLPGVQLPESASFQVTEKNGHKRVLGSAGKIKYRGSTTNPTKYALAVQQDDGSIKLVPTAVTDLIVTTGDSDDEGEAPAVVGWEQRNALGEAFGTKKAKSAITDKSRNRVDADTLQDLEDSIIGRVKSTTANLPSEEERTKAFAKDRAIPPHNLDTTNVRDVYPISQLVPARELDQIDTTQLQQAATEEERKQLLPYQDSAYINSRITKVISEDVNVSSRLALLSYLSLLMAVYQNRRINSKLQLVEKLGNPPEEIVSGIIERFTVAKAGMVGRSRDRSFAFDPTHLDKLLSYMLVLALHIDDFLVEISPLAHEVALKTSKLVSLFRNLGCTIRYPTATEATTMGVDARTYKLAKLTAPLNLPDTIKRGGKGQ